jgi:hypothetical protein
MRETGADKAGEKVADAAGRLSEWIKNNRPE